MNKNTTPDLGRYVEKPISETSQHLADWLTTNTGYAVDERTVSLVQDLHGAWQKGPENQKRIAERAAKAVAQRAEREQRAAAKLTKQTVIAESKPAPATAAAEPTARRAPRKAAN
jgi:hypothetical protein